MTIEERAEKWATEYEADQPDSVVGYTFHDLIMAYLAGSAQTQHDYTAGTS